VCRWGNFKGPPLLCVEEPSDIEKSLWEKGRFGKGKTIQRNQGEGKGNGNDGTRREEELSKKEIEKREVPRSGKRKESKTSNP